MAEIQVIRTDPTTGERSVGLMPEENLAADTSGQFHAATPEALEEYRKANTVTPGEALATVGEGLAQGASVGIYGAAAGQLAPEYAQGLAEQIGRAHV